MPASRADRGARQRTVRRSASLPMPIRSAARCVLRQRAHAGRPAGAIHDRRHRAAAAPADRRRATRRSCTCRSRRSRRRSASLIVRGNPERFADVVRAGGPAARSRPAGVQPAVARARLLYVALDPAHHEHRVLDRRDHRDRAVGAWPLRADRLRHVAAHAGGRRADGARRASGRRCRGCFCARPAPGLDRAGDRPRRRDCDRRGTPGRAGRRARQRSARRWRRRRIPGCDLASPPRCCRRGGPRGSIRWPHFDRTETRCGHSSRALLEFVAPRSARAPARATKSRRISTCSPTSTWRAACRREDAALAARKSFGGVDQVKDALSRSTRPAVHRDAAPGRALRRPRADCAIAASR